MNNKDKVKENDYFMGECIICNTEFSIATGERNAQTEHYNSNKF